MRSIFEGGGKVEIEQAVLPPIDLTEPPATAVALLNGIESTSRISGVSVELSPGIPRIKNIDINVRLAQGTAQVQVLRAQFTTVDLPSISGKVAKLFEAPLIDVTVKGPVQVSNQPPEDLAAFFRRCGLEEVNGSADLDAAVVVDTSHPVNVEIRGNIGLRDVAGKNLAQPCTARRTPSRSGHNAGRCKGNEPVHSRDGAVPAIRSWRPIRSPIGGPCR